MSDDLAAFLTARYDEVEALAKAASNGITGKWGPRLDQALGGHLIDDTGEVVVYDEGAPSDWQFDHIAANDPAHRLADIKLKRAILAEHPHQRIDHNWTGRHDLDGPFGCATCHIGISGDVYEGGWCATVRQLGTEFTEHPEYQESWKPE